MPAHSYGIPSSVTPSFPSSIEELKALAAALQTEKAADRREYDEYLRGMSLSRKKEAGLAIHPLQFQEARLYVGDLWLVRFACGDSRHRIQAGSPVRLFREDESCSAVLTRLGRGFVDVVLEDPPEWIEEGKPGLEAAFPDLVWQEMERALATVAAAERGPIVKLREGLLGYEIPAACRAAADLVLEQGNRLNEAQHRAVQGILASPDFTIVHGPPGTGKTTVLVSAIAAMARSGDSVLVAAPTNAAVDLLAMRLDEAGVPVLRIGHPGRVHEGALALTVDGRLESKPEAKLLVKYRAEAAELFRRARRYRRNFGAKEREERRSLTEEYRALQKRIREIEKALLFDLVDRSPVVCTTLTGATHPLLSRREFDVAVVDEATQALEPACWIPLLRAPRAVLAGDHCQLPPVVKSDAKVLCETLFEKAISRLAGTTASDRIFFLDRQYRMDPSILAFSNAEFYGGRMCSDESIGLRLPLVPTVGTNASNAWSPLLAAPFLFVDTAGADCEEERDEESESLRNPFEARLLVDLFVRITHMLEQPLGCGLIAPYRAQADLLVRLAAACSWPDGLALECDTVDSFQGAERDLIGLTLTRSNERGEIGFLSDLRRTNVAMTRARRLLILVGDGATLSAHPFYERLIDHARLEGAYRSVWDDPFRDLAGFSVQ